MIIHKISILSVKYAKLEDKLRETATLQTEKQSITSRSNPSLVTIETELQPLKLLLTGEKSSTLPRSFGLSGKSTPVTSDLQKFYPYEKSEKGATANEDNPHNTPTRLVRHESLKSVSQTQVDAHKKVREVSLTCYTLIS